MSNSFDLPEWVCWIAQDADGVWWGYQVEPNQAHQGWYENEVGNCIRLSKAQANDNWLNTLQRIK